MMHLFNKTQTFFAFSLTLLSVSLSFASQPDPQLEELFPAHFTGFAATPAELVEDLRKAEKCSAPLPSVTSNLRSIACELKKHGETFSSIYTDIDKMLETSDRHSPLQYIFILARIALFESRTSEDETHFFNSVGFPKPYNFIVKHKFDKDFKSFEEFVELFEKFDDEDDSEDDNFERHTHVTYHDDKETVLNKFVEKGPFAEVICPLVGKDELGFFYLAWAYYKGIQPVPFPLIDNNSELHGINMSRFGKVCHDLAHAEADATDHSAEQFAHNLINRYTTIVREKSELFSLAERKKISVKAMLPHFAEFAMSVHNLYRQSLVEILMKSLIEFDPRVEEKRKEFEAFSVAAFMHAHENPVDMSDKYGTSNLEDLLRASLDDEELEKTEEEFLKEQNEESDPFETSPVTGESPLSDEEIFEKVKTVNLYDFLGKDSNNFDKLNESLVSDFSVERNKFYIQVTVEMIDGKVHRYRKGTNYAKQLNFKHDRTILEQAQDVLKQKYGYEIPAIPHAKDFADVSDYDAASSRCYAKLEVGEKRLLDIWLKNAIWLSHKTSGAYEPSIADKYHEGYMQAFNKLKEALPEFVPDLKGFIQKATKGFDPDNL